MDVLRHLEQSGVQVAVVGDNLRSRRAKATVVVDAVIELTVDGRRARFAVEEKGRAPYPGEVDQLAERLHETERRGTPLLVAPFISEGTGERLVAVGWSWADELGNFDVRAPGLRLRQRLAEKPPESKRLSLPRGSGSWTLIRWLITNGDVTSLTRLALDAKVSQPRVSQVLQQLDQLGLISRVGRAVWRPDREQLLDRFLKEYPGPAGSEVYLYSLDEPLELALRLATRKPRLTMTVSADVGADLLVPWRRPTMLVVYTAAPLRLERSLDATVAHGRADANIIHRVPHDESVFALTREVEVRGDVVPVVDSPQLLWDLGALGGDDRIEAAEKLRQWLLTPR